MSHSVAVVPAGYVSAASSSSATLPPSPAPAAVSVSLGDAVRCILWASLTLGELLGHGGFGQVFAATWTPDATDASARHVAVKLLPIDSSPKRHQAFQREIRCMAALRHAHLVLVHGVCTDVRGKAGSLALVMERCECNVMDRLTSGS